VSRTLALDVGERRIGVAVSDPGGLVAQPLLVIERKGWEVDLRRITAIVQTQCVGEVVVGYPLTLSGHVGPQAQRVDRFIARLRNALSVEVVPWDERFTTAAAERALLEGDVRRHRRRRVRDALAAALLLQGYLDRRRRGSRGPGAFL
jgi:putative Holliday junction resolvase